MKLGAEWPVLALVLPGALGACSRSALEDESPIVVSGPSGDAGCPSAGLDCDGKCVNPLDDPLDCGACNHACPPGGQCVMGTCTGGCPAGATACASQCVDLSSDPDHCGGCNIVCPPAYSCHGSVCACPVGLTKCGAGGECVDLSSNSANCGACDTSCPPGSTCSGGACSPSCGPDQIVCPAPNGVLACTSSLTDPNNCGGCNLACPIGLSCVGGVCTLVCPAGQVVCTSGDGSQYCADTSSDPQNCGACGAVCSLPNVTQASCTAGKCVIDACAPGEVDCDAIAGNGCECKALACTQGLCGKRVFLTSQVFPGDLGGLSGADQDCQMLADQAGLGGSYKAWLSDSFSSPSTRFTQASVPYLRVDGVIVANDWNDLTDGTLAQPIDLTELGGPSPLGTMACGAWTATFSNGKTLSSFENCNNWTSTAAFAGFLGDIGATNFWWSAWCETACDYLAPLYCFEQ